MHTIGILFPHQLFEENELMKCCHTIYLVEEWLFFKQYNFHKQKIALHRASMKFYAHYLHSKNCSVKYINSFEEISDVRKLIPYLKSIGIESFYYLDTTDCWLENRIKQTSRTHGVHAVKKPSQLFINSISSITDYFSSKKKMFQTEFYIQQRKTRNILMDNLQKPLGNKWTFDNENRKKYPKTKIAPKFPRIHPHDFYLEAVEYTNAHFPNNYGLLDPDFIFPTTFEESKAWLDKFLQDRFSEFGPYEDAILTKEYLMHHSALTPMLNIGLITPEYIVGKALSYAQEYDIPLGSVEGFIRQIIGWREFIRAVYELKGSEERTKNYWGFSRKIPPSFWNGTTGIAPVDITIKKVLQTGYCHHIERLMVLGNFMLLCEFDPDEVYRWFMELFLDSYDWVMVPNVYGMSQFADGGLMSTKPYISGSNYLVKMSDYTKGDWQPIWDGLFWRFLHTHRNFFLQNPRLGMLVHTFDAMEVSKQELHLSNAHTYLESLSQ